MSWSAVETLRQRVIRARDSKHRPFVPTGKFPDLPEAEPTARDEHYAALVARGELQAWTPEQEAALKDKVLRLARVTPQDRRGFIPGDHRQWKSGLGNPGD